MDDEIDIQLREAHLIAARAIIVATVLRRLALEELAKTDDFDAAAEAFDLREWLRDQRLLDQATAHEQSLIDRPLGGFSLVERWEESWLGEGLLALAWAIGRGNLSSPGAPTAIDALLDELPSPWDDTAPWISGVQLHAESEIARERERAELWHWRADIESGRREAPPEDRQDYDLAIRDVSAEAAAAGLLNDRAENDFALSGRPVRALANDELDDLIAVSAERLRALNWLCGFGASWEDVPLSI